MEEIWKDITGFEGYYQASELGEIRSLERQKFRIKFGVLPVRGKILTPVFRGKYLAITLCNLSTKKMFSIHRIIAETFIPNPDNKPCVNHKDGNKLNNRADNLEWVTASENHIHAFKTGLRKPPQSWLGKKGDLHHSSIKIICINNGVTYGSIMEASRQLSISQTGIHNVLKGITEHAKRYIFKYA